MSYLDDPGANPYAAPKEAIAAHEFGGEFVQYGGFWRRVASYLIDSLFLGVIQGMFTAILVLGHLVPPDDPFTLPLITNAFQILLFLGYNAGMNSSNSQATLGKMAMGMKVTDLMGRRIGFGRAVGRELGKILSGLILCIGFLMVAFTERKQGLHDILAGTLVVKTR
jgi:uncharacterized RDD family membrane protein YckC